VPLLIDRLPLSFREVLIGGRRRRIAYALLPAIISDPNLPGPPAGAVSRWWKFDTACTLDACAWRFHLERAGLDPLAPDQADPMQLPIRTANDVAESLPTRRAVVWLMSNIPALRNSPLRLK
jgi:hypothetical protein